MDALTAYMDVAPPSAHLVYSVECYHVNSITKFLLIALVKLVVVLSLAARTR